MVDGTSGELLVVISNYLLPFFLYLFIFILLTDLLLLINLIFKIVPHNKINGRSFRGRIFILIICLSAAVVIAGIINFNTIRISEYRIEIPGKSSEIYNLKIAFVSDFHLEERTPASFVERFVKEIETIKPDLMLFGGDIVEGDSGGEKMRIFESLISSIKSKYGVYGVLGNHDHYAGQDKGSFFRNAGIHILNDTVLKFGNSFMLAGRQDSHVRTRKNIDEFLSSIPDSLPLIILDHRPTEIKEVSRTRADIQLSGHTHNGQLFPINLITKKVYELSYGYRKIGNTHFFVSSGIRLWGPPVRTIGKSEIIVIYVTA